MEEGAIVMVVRVLVGKRNNIRACSGTSLEERKRGGRFVPLVAGGEMGKVCACEETTGGGGEAAPAALRVDLDVEKSSGEEAAAWQALLRYAWK